MESDSTQLLCSVQRALGSTEQKQLIARAAALRGSSATDFIVASAPASSGRYHQGLRASHSP
ncbi:MAG: hypothetical protein DMG39_14735 [Acidobacteria bacterium]|nr:MAG: hypothetical protein DMG39_14735 [Acidobacteriota bacterium]